MAIIDMILSTKLSKEKFVGSSSSFLSCGNKNIIRNSKGSRKQKEEHNTHIMMMKYEEEWQTHNKNKDKKHPTKFVEWNPETPQSKPHE